jgi:uncharacterized protein (DUF1499 family)
MLWTTEYKTSLLKLLFMSAIIVLACPSVANPESKPEKYQAERSHNQTIFLPCPSTPNCVNSQIADDPRHFVEAIQLKESGIDKNRDKLLSILNTLPRVMIVTIDNDYIKAEFTSRYFSFVDDVEFFISENHIDVRSASRTGHHDLGVNRKRVEHIRSLFNEQ